LDADGRLLAAADGDEADIFELGNFGSEARVHQIFDLRERNGTGGNGQSEDGRVGRISFAVDRGAGRLAGRKLCAALMAD